MAPKAKSTPKVTNTPKATSTPSIPKATKEGQTKKTGSFFQDGNGNKSSMRLMSFIALIAGIIFGLITTLSGCTGPEGIYITFGFLLAAFVPNAIQKFAETKVK